MAFFMLVTSRLHRRGGVVPASKNDRGIVAAAGRLKAAEVKDVAEAIMGACAKPGVAALKPGTSALTLVTGDWPFMESIEVVGDSPLPFRFPGCGGGGKHQELVCMTRKRGVHQEEGKNKKKKKKEKNRKKSQGLDAHK